MRDEELLWFQKSRVNWIESGDKNTAFYHAAVMIRRNRNKISTLKINGEWISNPAVLKSHVVSYFHELFSRTEEVAPAQLIEAVQPRIEDAKHEGLLAPASIQEVKRALFSMKGTKSPGPDGIHAIFYKEN